MSIKVKDEKVPLTMGKVALPKGVRANPPARDRYGYPLPPIGRIVVSK